MATVVGLPAKDLKMEDPILASATNCLRCGGFMVAELCSDFWGDSENLVTKRCVQCGEVIDPVILQNRQRQLSGGRGAERSCSGLLQSKEGR